MSLFLVAFLGALCGAGIGVASIFLIGDKVISVFDDNVMDFEDDTYEQEFVADVRELLNEIEKAKQHGSINYNNLLEQLYEIIRTYYEKEADNA